MQPWEFFLHNAGHAYHPDRESEVVGAALGAIDLARAEAWAREQPDIHFVWDDDPEGADVQNEDGTWEHLPAVQCLMYRYSDDRSKGDELLECLCAITESDDFRERRNYRRVVEAELALQAMHTV